MNTAFFIASKVFWFFADPGNVVLFLVIAAAVLAWTRWKRTSRLLLTVTALFSLFVVTVPVGNYALRYLENRFPANPPLPEQIDGIIVLGGALDAVLTQARGQTSLNGSVERIIMFAELATQFPQAKLVYSGGSGLVTEQTLKEADYVAPILRQLGVYSQNVTFENQSRNTFENANFSHALINPKLDENWILITSAFHMPRAIGSFRKANWPILIPYPVDFIYKGDEILGPPLSLRSGITRFAFALHEWLGLTAYYLTNKTDEFIPASR